MPMRKQSLWWVVTLTFYLAAAGAEAQALKVEGRVVDAAGKAATGVDVAPMWDVDDESGDQKPISGGVTDADGRFSIQVKTYGREGAIAAYDTDRKNAGVLLIPKGGFKEPVEIKLAPAIHVHGKFSSKELGRDPGWINIHVKTSSGEGLLLQHDSQKPEFTMLLPAGEFRMDAYGSEVRGVKKTLKLSSDQPDVDMGTIDLPAQALALLKGKPFPPWTLADARGVKKDVAIADFRGKWVLVDIWGYWCGPCVLQLAEVIDFYEDHAADRDKFEILALHDGSVKDFAEMDAKTAGTKRSLWRGRDLPFPVLLDAPQGNHGVTVEMLQIQAFPTSLLIDPEGVLVGQSHLRELEMKLPAIPMARRVSRSLDRMVAIGLSNTPLNKAVEHLARVGGVPIILDEAVLEAAGVQADVAIPLKAAAALSLRSWIGLTLDPFGLAVKSADDGLHIVKADALREQTPSQRDVNQALEEKLAMPGSFDFQNLSLDDVVAVLEAKTQETFILDPVAVKAGRIDPTMKVSGKVQDAPLLPSLRNILQPLGVSVIAQDEAILLTN